MTPRTRRLILLICPLLLAAGITAMGRTRDAAEVSLKECVRDAAACAGAELFIGYARVKRVDGRAVFTRSWMGDLQLDPWPATSPLPSPGGHVSILGSHGGGRRVVPTEARHHPLRRRKELTGLTMLALWMLAGAGWVVHAWRRRGA